MVIDMHTHTFPAALAPLVLGKLQEAARAKIHIDGTTQALQTSMARAGVDRSRWRPMPVSLTS